MQKTNITTNNSFPQRFFVQFESKLDIVMIQAYRLKLYVIPAQEKPSPGEPGT